jgi:hypothetical protein
VLDLKYPVWVVVIAVVAVKVAVGTMTLDSADVFTGVADIYALFKDMADVPDNEIGYII